MNPSALSVSGGRKDTMKEMHMVMYLRNRVSHLHQLRNLLLEKDPHHMLISMMILQKETN